jgi:hypothetical protein
MRTQSCPSLNGPSTKSPKLKTAQKQNDTRLNGPRHKPAQAQTAQAHNGPRHITAQGTKRPTVLKFLDFMYGQKTNTTNVYFDTVQAKLQFLPIYQHILYQALASNI